MGNNIFNKVKNTIMGTGSRSRSRPRISNPTSNNNRANNNGNTGVVRSNNEGQDSSSVDSLDDYEQKLSNGGGRSGQSGEHGRGGNNLKFSAKAFSKNDDFSDGNNADNDSVNSLVSSHSFLTSE